MKPKEPLVVEMVTNAYAPSIRLLDCDTVLISEYQTTEPFGTLFEKHIVERETKAFGTRFIIVTKLGDESERYIRAYRSLGAAQNRFKRVDVNTE